MVWLTDERRLALFQPGPEIRRKEENHISSNPHHLPTPSRKLLSLITAFLIIARCDECSRAPGRYQFIESEGLRWPSFYLSIYLFIYLFIYLLSGYQFVEAERSKWPGMFVTSLLKLKDQDGQIFVTSISMLKS